MRAILLVLALTLSGCTLFRVQTPPASVQVAASPSSVSAEARAITAAGNAALVAIEQAVTAGTLPKDQAIRQVTAIRAVARELQRLSDDLDRWAETTDPTSREQRRAAALQRVQSVGRLLAGFDRPPWWGALLDAYVKTALAAGGAQ